MNIIDTLCNGYDRLRPLAYVNADLFFICFSLVSRSSFESVTTMWKPEVSHYRPEAKILLVGTKLDLRSNTEKLDEAHVSTEEGMALAKEISAIGYAECSVLTEDGATNAMKIALKGLTETQTKEVDRSNGYKGCLIL